MVDAARALCLRGRHTTSSGEGQGDPRANLSTSLPLNPGELATFLILVKERDIPAWKVAWQLGYKLRAVRYHIANLKDGGLVRVYPRFKDHRRLANSYYPTLFAPPPRTAFKDLMVQYRQLLLKAKAGGAKRRTFLLLRILTLLEEIARRLKADAQQLFLLRRLLMPEE